MKHLAVALVALFLTSACGPDWGDCRTCRPGEDSAESVDGSDQIPVDVNVTVIVNVDVDQEQTQTQTTPPVTPPPTTPVNPPKECRKVCSCVKRTYDCGKKHGHKSSCKKKDKCVKEVVRCS